MTAIGEVTSGTGATNRRVKLWYYLNPDSGSGTFDPQCSDPDICTAIAISFSDVSQASPIGTTDTNSGTAATSSSIDVPSALDDLVVDCINVRDDEAAALTAGAGQTEREDLVENVSMRTGLSTEPGATSTTEMSWSWTDNDDHAVLHELSAAQAPTSFVSIRRSANRSSLT